MALTSVGTASGQTGDYGTLDNRLPKELEGVGVTEKLEDMLPLDLVFQADSGAMVRLKDYFDGRRPVIVVLYYSDCPLLCESMLTGLMDVLKKVTLHAGDDYQLVAVSIDPKESLPRTRVSKTKYLQLYGKTGAGNGFHFLIGQRASSEQLAAATGIKYQMIRGGEEYSHPAVVVVATPEGKISRYLYGVAHKEQDVRLSLVEASAGRVGSSFDQVLLFCFHYDETEGRYAPAARNIMAMAGGLTVIILMFLLIPNWPWAVQRNVLVIGMVTALIPIGVAVAMGNSALLVMLGLAELAAAVLLLVLAVRERSRVEQSNRLSVAEPGAGVDIPTPSAAV